MGRQAVLLLLALLLKGLPHQWKRQQTVRAQALILVQKPLTVQQHSSAAQPVLWAAQQPVQQRRQCRGLLQAGRGL